MFNYARRILLSSIIAILLTISLFTFSYFRELHLANYEFTCLIGSLSEDVPEELGPILKRIGTELPSDTLYKKGNAAMTALGYGTHGRAIFNERHISIVPYLLYCALILGAIIALQFYVQYPVIKIKKIANSLILDIERAMGKYPVKFETSETNILIVNRLVAQITALVDQLNHQIRLLKLAQNDRTVFIENISHQIKTPLTCISLDLELLENTTDISRIPLYTNSCYTQIEHVETLLNRLLKIGKLESGNVHYEFMEHNLLDTISVLCNRLDSQYPNKKATLLYDDAQNYIISYDIVWLYEALENIVKNCYLYSFDHEGIEITLVRYESFIKIVLSDHGIGIPQEDLPNIFDRFYRSKETQNKEGFGIGLNLAKLVIEGHHGTIFAQSDHHSTEFIIHLPIII